MAHRSASLICISLLMAAAFLLCSLPGGGLPASAADFTVDSTADVVDANPGDGVCDDGAGNCTLRAAVQETNALAGPDTITLQADTYTLSIVGTGENAAADGDLDITDDLTITGAGAAATIIDGNGGVTGERAFDADPTFTGITVDISGVTIRNGSAANVGGGIINGGGTLTLNNVTVSGNTAHAGGGIYNAAGTLTLANVTVTSNTAAHVYDGHDPGIIGGGGGIFNNSGATLTLSNTSVISNTASAQGAGSADGGGIHNRGTLSGTNVTVSDNTTTAPFGSSAGGISNFGDATLVNIAVIRNTSVTPGAGPASAGGLANAGLPYTGGLTLTNATVSGNSASSDCCGTGGGIDNQGTMVLNATTITNNTAKMSAASLALAADKR